MDRIERGGRRGVKMQTTFSWFESSRCSARKQIIVCSVRSGPRILKFV